LTGSKTAKRVYPSLFDWFSQHSYCNLDWTDVNRKRPSDSEPTERYALPHYLSKLFSTRNHRNVCQSFAILFGHPAFTAKVCSGTIQGHHITTPPVARAQGGLTLSPETVIQATEARPANTLTSTSLTSRSRVISALGGYNQKCGVVENEYV